MVPQDAAEDLVPIWSDPFDPFPLDAQVAIQHRGERVLLELRAADHPNPGIGGVPFGGRGAPVSTRARAAVHRPVLAFVRAP